MASTKDDILKDSVAHFEHVTEEYSHNVDARFVLHEYIQDNYLAPHRLTSEHRILNPLTGLTKSELRTQVAAFCQEFGFEAEEEIFFRGALAAQNPDRYGAIEELTPEDKTLLGREVTHKWHLPRQLYFTVALCSLGSAIQGWDNTGANGANLSFPQEFGIADNEWLIGVINSVSRCFHYSR